VAGVGGVFGLVSWSQARVGVEVVGGQVDQRVGAALVGGAPVGGGPVGGGV